MVQFKDCLISISSSLRTGLSLESSISEACKEIQSLYTEGSYMAVELRMIIHKISLSISVETAFDDFSKRTDLDDIITFCAVLRTGKRTGGDLISIMNLTSSTITEKTSLKRDLERIISGKRSEFLIMALMPLLIMVYIKYTSSGFFDSVYHNISGIFFMTFCLILYFSSVLLALRILDLEV